MPIEPLAPIIVLNVIALAAAVVAYHIVTRPLNRK